jgi:hypothetical protein
MKDEYYPQDFTIIDAGIDVKDAVRKYPDSYILMMNLRYTNAINDEMVGDIFLVCDDREEFGKIKRRLKGFGGIGNYAGENITMASLGLNSLR